MGLKNCPFSALLLVPGKKHEFMNFFFTVYSYVLSALYAGLKKGWILMRHELIIIVTMCRIFFGPYAGEWMF